MYQTYLITGESDSAVTDSQKKIKNLLFENGVDAIIGSHSHIVGPMEQEQVTTVDGTEKTCFVAYSLGTRTGDWL